MIRLLCLAGTMAMTAGCGLIDADITDFDLSLPEREVIVDTTDWMLSDGGSGEGVLPAVDCSANNELCGAAMEEFCSSDDVCSGACNQTTETCEVGIDIGLWHTFELGRERPELEKLEGQPLVSVTIKRVYYTVTENTLNVDSPQMDVFVAPEGVMSPSDSSAVRVGTIPVVAAGVTVVDADMQLTEAGENILADYMQDYDTPFNLIVGADIVVGADDELPTGRMVAVIKANATAGL